MPLYRKILYAAVTTLIFWFCLNLLLGFIFKESPQETPPMQGIYDDHKYRYTCLVPGRQTKLKVGWSSYAWQDKNQWYSVKINSLGLRDEEISRKKPPGTYRILMLGDSATFGWDVEFTFIYTEILEDLLNGVTGACSGERRFEVINAGIPGYKTIQGLIWLETELLELEPDLITIGYGVNDSDPCDRRNSVFKYFPEDNIYSRDEATGEWKPINPLFFSEHALKSMNSYKALREVIQVVRQQTGMEFNQKFISGEETCRVIPLEKFRAYLLEMGRMAQTRNMDVMYILFALNEAEYKNALQDAASEIGAPLVNTLPLLLDAEKIIRTDPRFAENKKHYEDILGKDVMNHYRQMSTTDGGHPNRMGHRIIAEYLFTHPALLNGVTEFLEKEEPSCLSTLYEHAGWISFYLRDFEKAEGFFEKSISENSENSSALLGHQASLYMRGDKHPDGMGQLASHLHNLTQDAQYIIETARITGLLELERYSEAASIYNNILIRNPDNEHYRILYHRTNGLDNFRSGRWSDAANDFRILTDLVPDDPEIRRLLGKSLAESGEWKTSAEALREAIKFDPLHAETHFLLAMIFDKLGEPESAVPEWRRCMEISENFREQAIERLEYLDEASSRESNYAHDHGYAYMISIADTYPSDGGADGDISNLVLYEDSQKLGPAHCKHDSIRILGAGRYSHFQGTLYFSSTDNSDPNLNDRNYVWKIED